jgi:hypothetical protein
MVHLPREEGERRRERRAHRGIACERERRDRSIRDDDVREGGREDKVGARAERDRRKHRHDPVHAAVSRECEPEEREGDEHPTHLSHQETEFCGWVLAMRVFVSTVPPLKKKKTAKRVCRSAFSFLFWRETRIGGRGNFGSAPVPEGHRAQAEEHSDGDSQECQARTLEIESVFFLENDWESLEG